MQEYNNDMRLVEKFLDGQLTEEELRAFEDRRSTHPDFNKMILDINVLMQGIHQSAAKTSKAEKLERLRFYAEITDMEEHAAVKTRIPSYRKVGLWASVGAIMCILLFGWFYMATTAPNYEKLFTTYFEPFDSPGNGLTRGTNEVTLKARAYDAYDNGRLEEAIGLFKEILSTKYDPIIHLCLGNAQLMTGKTQEAEASFIHLLDAHSDLVTPAKWYLALTYLKENKPERVKSTLWEISKSSTYGEKARRLLKQLK
jgi:tetratricopeptide (TPR) repeat protein